MKIWQIYAKNNFNCFFEDTVYISATAAVCLINFTVFTQEDVDQEMSLQYLA